MGNEFEQQEGGNELLNNRLYSLEESLNSLAMPDCDWANRFGSENPLSVLVHAGAGDQGPNTNEVDLEIATGSGGLHNLENWPSEYENMEKPSFLNGGGKKACLRRRPLIHFSNTQRSQLEWCFRQNRFPCRKEKEEFAEKVGLTAVQVENWFKRRRFNLARQREMAQVIKDCVLQHRSRSRFDKTQRNVLEYIFEQVQNPSAYERKVIAMHTGLSLKQVDDWFACRRYTGNAWNLNKSSRDPPLNKEIILGESIQPDFKLRAYDVDLTTTAANDFYSDINNSEYFQSLNYYPPMQSGKKNVLPPITEAIVFQNEKGDSQVRANSSR
ncbi:hypothetical protein Aperf_G00000103326 [Anoplocephala perfoliata]